jgi:hypothetical protein
MDGSKGEDLNQTELQRPERAEDSPDRDEPESKQAEFDA